jgi:hypothetical protein
MRRHVFKSLNRIYLTAIGTRAQGFNRTRNGE